MMQIPCSSCKSKFTSISSLQCHYKYFHSNFKNFNCHVDQCLRKFGEWDSYRKHLISVHGVPLRVNEESAHSSNAEQNSHGFSFPFPEPDDSDVPGTDFSIPLVTIKDLKLQVQEAASSLTAKFLSRPGLPRCFVDVLIKDISNFLSEKFFISFQQLVFQNLSATSENSKALVQQAFDVISNPFAKLETEYRRLQIYKNCGDYIEPVPYDIGLTEVTDANGRLSMQTVQGQSIPISKVLKKFMEIPGCLTQSLKYVEAVKHDDDMLSSFMQCSVWKRKISKFKDGEIVFPLHVYYDDFEVNNPLGPHTEPLGGVYLQLPFLPPECQGKLDNILLALLFNANDRKISNEKTFKPLIEELTKLENDGISIDTSEGKKQVYFVTGVLLGDNKGLNGMCGFVEAFSAHHCCRICKIHKDQLVSATLEDPNLLRTKENYLSDVAIDNATLTGVKERCVFDQIPSFETPTDISIDPFHDTDEGISHYVMISVLVHFHQLLPNFIENLNGRMCAIPLGVDKDNRPPSIDIDKVINKNKLKMTGAEMLTFVRLFGILVVDLIPEGDPYYEMYLILNDIVSICHAKVLPRNISSILEIHVSELNTCYIELTGDTLKPKHHFLVHYARLVGLFGPPANLSTIRLEAKHKLLKSISNVCCSRRNLPKTVAIKSQLHLCYRFMSKESITPALVMGSGQVLDLKSHNSFKHFSKSLPPGLDNDQIFCPKWVDFKGTRYSQRDVIIFGYGDACPEFAEIELILPHADTVYFICSPLATVGYYSEVRGYEVEKFNLNNRWFCCKQEKLIDPYPLTLHKTARGEHVLLVKSFL